MTTESVEEFVNKEGYKDLLDGTIFIAPKTDFSDFEEKYKERFGIEPVFSASNSYDATKIIIEAFQNTDGSTEAVRDYLNGNTFQTVTFGEMKFDKIGGVTGGTFVIKQVENGKAKVIAEI